MFFFLGFKTQRVEVGGQQDRRGRRHVADRGGLDEVVVVGYETQSRRTITSAMTQIDGDLKLADPSVDILGEALKGKIAGARVYGGNNTPGADP